MGFRQAEEVILPARFLTTVAHLVTVIAVLDGREYFVARSMGANGSYGKENKQLEVMACVALACLVVEFLGLLSGLTIFMRGLNCFHTFMHFFGAVLTWLFMEEHWKIDHYIPILVVFNGLPFLGEVLGILAVGVLKLPL
ncbi:hypothetical protein BSKO_07310 [Bryopsis sp. KO-2023]|nr:hypothetical protein BSKO_07310 [Bryopsis sp. KO-2023]